PHERVGARPPRRRECSLAGCELGGIPRASGAGPARPPGPLDPEHAAGLCGPVARPCAGGDDQRRGATRRGHPGNGPDPARRRRRGRGALQDPGREERGESSVRGGDPPPAPGDRGARRRGGGSPAPGHRRHRPRDDPRHHRRPRRYHALAGHGLEELYAGRIDEVVELLAYHFGRSEEAENAVDYALLAAEKAQRRWANTEALAYFDDALKRLSAMPDTEANR